MKKILVLVILFAGVVTGLIFWWSWGGKPFSTDSTVRDFLIGKGASASQIGNKLAQERLIKSPLAFKFYVQITGKSGKIQAGEYALSPNLSLFEIVNELLRGPKEIWVTIPEGLRREEIAERFATGLVKENKEEFIKEFLEASTDKEGFLFPDTYIFPKTAKASTIVSKLFSTFEKKVDSKMDDDIKSSDYDLNQILTMASIVERETITDAERPIVAGILFNRLKAGWPLQADATLQYAIGTKNCKSKIENCKWWEIPEVSGRNIDSLYNTYRNSGLPPGPIASPGLSSIEAAIYPESSDYWYYIHDPKGKIYYARTLEEHNENVRTYITN